VALKWRQLDEKTDSDTLIDTARTLCDAGRVDEAIRWWMRAGDMGNPYGMRNASSALIQLRREAEAVRWLKKLGERGNEYAISETASILARHRQIRDASRWLTSLAAKGNIVAIRELARLLTRTGDARNALTWWPQVIRALPIPEPPVPLRKSLNPSMITGTSESHGWDPLKVEYKFRNSNTAIIRSAIAAYQGTGRQREAAGLLRHRALAGDGDAVREVAKMYLDSGDPQAAVDWLAPLAEAGNEHAMRRLAYLYEYWDYVDEAAYWWVKLSRRGRHYAIVHLARLYQRSGRLDEAINWWQQAVEHAEDYIFLIEASDTVVALLTVTGRTEEILPWLKYRSEAGDLPSSVALFKRLKFYGSKDDALAFSSRMAAQGIHLPSNETYGIQTDNGGYRHYFQRAKASNSILLRERVTGLCGWSWRLNSPLPGVDVSQVPVCPRCTSLYNSLPEA